MDPQKLIQTFYPTWEEFKDFQKYIAFIESKGANKAGLARIVPPKEYIARKSGYDDVKKFKVTIKKPIYQASADTDYEDVYQQVSVPLNQMSVSDFKKLANSPKHAPPAHSSYDDLESSYWNDMTTRHGIYGADINGTLTDADLEYWNINKLGSILDYVEKDYNISIDGVNTSYLYFGMYKTTFAWHTEDMDLYSINYLHFGAPKTWYSIPPVTTHKFEHIMQNMFKKTHKVCPAFLRHKMTVINPRFLQSLGIHVNKITQEAGDIMITFPYGYHSGFNHGFNCAESTNFATERWVEYGKHSSICYCCPDSVKISMDAFVQRFQPENLKKWKEGRDDTPHPENKKKSAKRLKKNKKQVSFKLRNPELNIENLLENETIEAYIKEELKASYDVSAEDEEKIMIEERIHEKKSFYDSSEDEFPRRRRSKRDNEYDDDWYETKGHAFISEDGKTLRRTSGRKRVPTSKVIESSPSIESEDEDSDSSIEKPVKKKRPSNPSPPKIPAIKKVVKIEDNGTVIETFGNEEKRVTVRVSIGQPVKPASPVVVPPVATTPTVKPSPSTQGYESAFAAFLSIKREVQSPKPVKKPAIKSKGRPKKTANSSESPKLVSIPPSTTSEKGEIIKLNQIVKQQVTNVLCENDRVKTEKIPTLVNNLNNSIQPAQKIEVATNGRISVVPTARLQKPQTSC